MRGTYPYALMLLGKNWSDFNWIKILLKFFYNQRDHKVQILWRRFRISASFSIVPR